MATGPRNFKISDAPLSPPAIPREPEDISDLPSHYGPPVLLAIARNPETLFVCWSVDWHAAFASNLPPDRKGHVKLKSGSSERVEAVEPLNGFCSITDLQPGETYAVELGFYAPASQWHVIGSEEVTMPLPGATANVETSIDVATVPFHLNFHRLTELFGGHLGLAQSLAMFEERMATNSVRTEEDEELLRALHLSHEDLQFVAAIRQALAEVKPSHPLAEHFSGSSFGGSNPQS
jgi:hypothetical protein